MYAGVYGLRGLAMAIVAMVKNVLWKYFRRWLWFNPVHGYGLFPSMAMVYHCCEKLIALQMIMVYYEL